MRKYSFLIYHKDYDAFLEQLRTLGVMHVIEKGEGSIDDDDTLSRKLEDAKKLKSAITFLSARLGKEDKPSEVIKEDFTELIHKFRHTKRSLEKVHTASALLQKEIEKMSVWGDFDFELVEKLKQAGYILTFYSCSARNFKEEWIEKYNAVVSNRAGGQIYFVTVTKEPVTEEIAADKVKLSDRSYSDLLEEQEEFKELDILHNKELDDFAINGLNTFKHALIELQNDIEFNKVKFNTRSGAENKVMILEGWVPEVKEPALVEMLQNEGIFYETAVPGKEENVPVLLRNNKFARLFEQIGGLYSLPNYHGMDMTALWAPFYVMFFGICLGDAGYGTLLLLFSLIMIKRSQESLKPIFRLTMWLGIGTIIFGFIGGSFFGIPLLEVEWLGNLRKAMLNSDQLFNFALILGVVQLTYAMIIKGIKEILLQGFKYSLDTWGWLLCLWGNGLTYLLTSNGTIPAEMSGTIYTIVNIIAFGCMLFFNNPDANILVNIGGGLWGLYNKATGILGDILSYIRLFALSISGAVMGLVFNQLATSIGESVGIPVVSQLIMIIILIIGHSMNIFMNGLGAFVHPMRLTFVEFYNNAGFESGGKAYNPFKKIKHVE